jgi:beta-lactamase class A
MRSSSLPLAIALATIAFLAVPPAEAKVNGQVQGSVIPVVATPASEVSASVLTISTEHVATTAAGLMHSPLILAGRTGQLVSASGANVGVTLIELGGSNPLVWSYGGGGVFTAASTYKLAALMMTAQNIAARQTDPNGVICYEEDDYEAGWFDDYEAGACFTRNELAWRAGNKSDNTAGHMLVRDLGGADALNAWAASHGAKSSAFFVGNNTTSNDLAALWAAEARGQLGGSAAQAWLYPLLTGTATEGGIPAGVGRGATVVHKTGILDQEVNDAALVQAGNKSYVLTVMTDGLGGSEGFQLIASISAEVNQFEESRPQ